MKKKKVSKAIKKIIVEEKAKEYILIKIKEKILNQKRVQIHQEKNFIK